tara:strand:+ start:197 stop:409 length:213 start_codon:yes stop_codon:yes gene_type:complete
VTLEPETQAKPNPVAIEIDLQVDIGIAVTELVATAVDVIERVGVGGGQNPGKGTYAEAVKGSRSDRCGHG